MQIQGINHDLAVIAAQFVSFFAVFNRVVVELATLVGRVLLQHVGNAEQALVNQRASLVAVCDVVVR